MLAGQQSLKRLGGRKALAMALEPRLMFDGAAVATAVDTAHAASDAAHAAPDAAAKAQIPAATAPVEVQAGDSAKDGGKKEVVFVDVTTPDWQGLVAGIEASNPGVEIALIGSGGDGLAQIAAWAETHSGYDAIHILTGGGKGVLALGGEFVTQSTIASDVGQAELAQIGAALKSGGEISLYGSNVGAGTSGAAFLAALAEATGAIVEAADHAVGGSDLGGSWQLDVSTGVGTTDSLSIAAYAGTLGIGDTVDSGTVAPVEVQVADAGLNNGKTEVTFIDTSLANWQSLVAEIQATSPGMGIELIDGTQSGLEALAAWGESHSGYDAIHILSHGGQGALFLGTDIVTDSSLATEAVGSQWAALGQALTSDGDLLLYACDVAAGTAGKQFLADLSTVVGAEVAASTNATGAASLSGDWVLEWTTGGIDVSALDLAGYGNVLTGLGTLSVTVTIGGSTINSTNIGSGLYVAFDWADASDNMDYFIDNYGLTTDYIYIDPGASTVTNTIVDDSSAHVNSTDISVLFSGAGLNSITLNSTSYTGSLLSSLEWAGATGSTLTFNRSDSGGWDNSANNGTMVLSITANFAPTGPSLTSAAYDAGSGALVVTAAGMTTGDGIATSKLTLTGEGGQTYTLAGSYTVTADSATSFTINLDATDRAALALIMNKDGISSTGGTAFNIAGAADWDTSRTTSEDATGNAVTVNSVTPPTVTSATYDVSTGVLVVTGSNFVRSGTAVDGNDIDVSRLILTGEGGQTYTLTSSDVDVTSGTSFTVTLNAADRAALALILNKDDTSSTGGTTYNIAGTSDGTGGWNAGDSTKSADTTGNGVTVSGVTAPTITSATYDVSTGVLVVTGSNFVRSGTAVDGNDIDVSRLVLTGEGGQTYTLTSSDVDVTSATSFTVTLNAADQAALALILNKDDTSSTGGTIYNIAGTSDGTGGWNAGDSTKSADTTGNGVTVSVVTAPTITSATYDVSTGALVVTGSNFVRSGTASDGNDIDVSRLVLTGEGGQTYTLTSSDVDVTSATSFTVTLNATDRAALALILNKDDTSSTGGTTYNIAGTSDGTGGWNAGDSTKSADTTGNGVTVSGVTAPTVTSAAYDYATRQLVVTGSNFVRSSGADIDVTKLKVVGEGGGTYILSSSSNVEVTSATSFTVTLAGADIAYVEGLLDANGTNAATSGSFTLEAAAGFNAGDATSAADTTGNAITVSGYAAPAITSASYNAGTGVLTVTGTHLAAKTGLTNDIDATKLTLTGEGGNTYTLTAATANVDVTSDTSFSVTLTGADLLNVNGLLNKLGTSAGDNTTYNIAAAAGWAAGGAATSTDLTGNGISVTNILAPTVTSATYDPTTGQLVVTGTNLVSNFGSVNDIDVSKLTLTGAGNGTYTLTAATANVEITSATSFTVTISGADKTAVDALLDTTGTNSGGVTYNLAAADGWVAALADGGVSSTDASDNGITVSIPPVITSATYNESTGALVVTGSNFVANAGNDIDVTKITVTGKDGSTYTLTTASAGGGFVSISSATSFTITLAGADKTAVDALLDVNGTSSSDSTAYNIAAAANWDAGYGASGAADLTSNAITVSNAPPGIASATYNVSTGALTVTGFNMVTGDTIDASKLTLTGEGGLTHVLAGSYTVTAASATSFTVTLDATDQAALALILNKDNTSSTGHTTFNIAGAANWDSSRTTSADATNAVTVSGVTAPTITSATYNVSTGALVVTGSNFVRSGTAADNNDIDVSKLTLKGEGGQTYTLTSSDVDVTSATSFTVTLNAADLAALALILNKDNTSSTGGTTYDIAAAAGWAAGDSTSAADNTAANAVTVSGVTAPTITSATYDASTGALVVTGSNFVRSGTAVDGNDIDVSRLVLTGEGGQTYTLTSSDVDVTSATSFTVTLNATDRAALALILNKDDTSSTGGTTYNIAAAAGWAAGDSTSAADNTAANAVTVSGVTAPTITSATYDASTGTLVVTGSNFVRSGTASDHNDIDVSTLTLKGEGGLTYTLTSSDVDVTSATSFTLTLNATDQAALALRLTMNGTSSTDATVYNIAAAAGWAAGDSTSAADNTAANAVTVSGLPAPTITSATYNVATGALVVTGSNLARNGTTSDNNDIVVSKLTLTGEGGQTYALTSSDVDITSATSFTLTLNATDQAALALILNKDNTSSTGGTTYNIAGAAGWNAGDSTNSADATNAVTVSGVTVPTITSATYDVSTGALVVTGTNLVRSGTAADNNDIDVSTLTLKGEGGQTYTLTSSDIDVTSATSFTVTLNATDRAALALILNKDNTSSTGGTTYDIAAAAGWAAGDSTAAADNTAANAVTVSGVTAPTITSATYDISTGALVVTGTNLVRSGTAADNNDIDVSKLTLKGEGGQTYTLTSSDVDVTSATSFTLTLNATDTAAVAALLTKNGTSSSDATVYNIAAAAGFLRGDSNVAADTTGNGVTVSNVPAPTPVPPPVPPVVVVSLPVPPPPPPVVPQPSAPDVTIVRGGTPSTEGRSPSVPTIATVAPPLSLAPVLSAGGDGSFRVAVLSASAQGAFGGGDTIVVARPIGEVSTVDGRVAFSLPADAFAVSNADTKVSLSAVSANGGALPGWLSFNPKTGTFVGTPPPGAKAVEVKVTARDSQGHEASQVFRIAVQPAQKNADASPVESAARLAQAGRPGLAAQLHAARHDGQARVAAMVHAARNAAALRA